MITSQPFDIVESDRLAALNQFDILDTPKEEAFDRIARLITNIFEVPIGIVSMIDGHRQWYKAVEGLTTSEADLNTTFCRQTIQTSEPVVVADASLDSRFSANPHVTGEPHIRFYAGVPLRTQDGHNLGTVCAVGFKPRVFTSKETQILVDLTQIAMNELEIRQLATTDALTGIMSRRAFKQEATRAIALAMRYQHTMSCIVFDLDFFKAINDTHGHACGDQVLIEATAVCRERLRKSDLIGRLGGEEFAVLLPHTGLTRALQVAETLRDAISRISFDFAEKAVRLTASFGVTETDAVTKDIDGLMAHADVALYEAKRSGRNKCLAWHSLAGPVDQTSRRSVLKAGRIIFNNRNSMIDCTVRTLSESGAGLDVISAIGIPDKFSLAVKSDDFESHCKVVSQAERHFEVEFLH